MPGLHELRLPFERSVTLVSSYCSPATLVDLSVQQRRSNTIKGTNMTLYATGRSTELYQFVALQSFKFNTSSRNFTSKDPIWTVHLYLGRIRLKADFKTSVTKPRRDRLTSPIKRDAGGYISLPKNIT